MLKQFPIMTQSLATHGLAIATEPTASLEALQELVVGIACHLGTPRPSRPGSGLVDHLRPVSELAAKPRSLSALYGTGTFPWHTDGAHWVIPPHYLVLACVEAPPNSAATVIRDARLSAALNSETASRALFKVQNGPHSFYTTPVSSLRNFYRYDYGCMSPMNETARCLRDAIEGEQVEASEVISWEPGLIAVIDNWRYLHKRTDAGRNTGRHLLRVTVME